MAEPPAKRARAAIDESEEKENETTCSFSQQITNLRLATAKSAAEFDFDTKRVRVLSKAEDVPEDCEGILLWMARDQRVQDNWAMLYAQRLALEMEVPLHVCFCLLPSCSGATYRQCGFMLKGLREVEQECLDLDIEFHLLIGSAKVTLPAFVKEHGIGGVVTDFCPLRAPTQWVEEVTKELPPDIPFFQVDAHNIVPCWEASLRQEYGAKIFRLKVNEVLSSYLTEFPPVIQHPHRSHTKYPTVDWSEADDSLEVDRSVPEVTWARPGSAAGLGMLESFVRDRLRHYGTDRHNANKNAVSSLSAWLHFGQVSPQRAVLMVRPQQSTHPEAVEAYLEEAVVRRELADNYCFHEQNYDSMDGALDWARQTLQLHRKDNRLKKYSREQLEQGQTHEDLWNAAQTKLVTEGKLHCFLRMYWAKKVLEWTPSPQQALQDAVYLNDRYSLDGNDPCGYAGVMWAICGIHDQSSDVRPVFGKVRYMNYNGCKRKFDVAEFVHKYSTKKSCQDVV